LIPDFVVPVILGTAIAITGTVVIIATVIVTTIVTDTITTVDAVHRPIPPLNTTLPTLNIQQQLTL
jgi:hypothetical protein